MASLLEKSIIEEVNGTHPKRGFFSRLLLVKKRLGGGGVVKTCHRPVSTQPVYSVSTLQDGNCGFYHTSASKK